MKVLKQIFMMTALLAPVFAAPARAVIDTSPGKNSVYVSSSTATLTTSTVTPVLTGSMQKGKKKHVLEITGTVRGSVTGAANAVGLMIKVNGYYPEPSTSGFLPVVALCNSSYFCGTSTHVFVDIDAMESAHPGEFAGMPLTIQLFGAVGSGSMTGADVSIQAHYQKK